MKRTCMVPIALMCLISTAVTAARLIRVHNRICTFRDLSAQSGAILLPSPARHRRARNHRGRELCNSDCKAHRATCTP
jgi:hypothetical protein